VRALPAALLLVASPAAAMDMDETLDISISERTAWIDIDSGLSPALGADGVPALDAAHPRISGDGALFGAVGRIGATLDGVRLGLGTGAHGIAFLDFRHAPLAGGVQVASSSAWGAPLEGYLGYTFGDAEETRLFFELRGGFTIVQARVTLTDPELGTLGETVYNAYYPNLDLRIGARIPIEKYFFFEGGIAISPLPSDIGPERGSLFVTLGLPISMDAL
jgi:hypothetical protein